MKTKITNFGLLNKSEIEDWQGETHTDLMRSEAYFQRQDYLEYLEWEILDLIPNARLKEIQQELIEEIIENGWDK